jgi:hypothetical protein
MHRDIEIPSLGIMKVDNTIEVRILGRTDVVVEHLHSDIDVVEVAGDSVDYLAGLIYLIEVARGSTDVEPMAT